MLGNHSTMYSQLTSKKSLLGRGGLEGIGSSASTSAFTTDRLPNFSGNSEMASPFRSHIHGGDTKNRDGVLFVDPQQPVLSVAPLNSMPYTGPHVISSDDDLSPTEMESDPMASNEPALVFLPSRPTEEQWNNILAATNRGVGLTGSAAMGKIGPIVGSLDMAESEDAYVFRVSLPGVNQSKLDIRMNKKWKTS
ncbi:hypothetical protein TEA_009998 [Camellia sinensis var. sinensis]|uniref:SHSP domain-containing protein n=2 Tax=Camellia sinensis TaxID=4442 RepID=A0A4V6RY72_CAMSN|nr:hypothetical protein TEA_009998 [Camellia sinensis var. sinensis]